MTCPWVHAAFSPPVVYRGFIVELLLAGEKENLCNRNPMSSDAGQAVKEFPSKY